MLAKPKSIDEYLAPLAADRRAALEKLRQQIHALLPRAEECISYSMPAFRIDAQVIAGFLATSEGCSYYPFSGRTLTTLAPALAAYNQTKGALHFDPKRGLPKTLVRKLLIARLAETPRLGGATTKAPTTRSRVAKAKPKPK
ncbi:MAG TPA: DUF1801 domain-containing protein, partial [Polyangiaceae bacterium]